jgi:steroid delta-isomerase-like uncharacterized protein
MQDNKGVVRRLIEEGMNKNNPRVVEELVAPSFATREQDEMRMVGVDGFKELLAVYRTAFPDFRLTVSEMIAEGDKVITWATFTGTHRGPLEKLPATGRAVSVKDVDLWRVQNGKVVESWANFDQWGLMKQLGVIPEEGAEEEER